jgi:hypothetical protein
MRRFDTAHHWTCCWASSIHLSSWQPISVSSILLLSFQLLHGLLSDCILIGFPRKFFIGNLLHNITALTIIDDLYKTRRPLFGDIMKYRATASQRLEKCYGGDRFLVNSPLLGNAYNNTRREWKVSSTWSAQRQFARQLRGNKPLKQQAAVFSVMHGPCRGIIREMNSETSSSKRTEE